MAKTIDERIVEMKFDNSNFEKNVSGTMSTLDKLKEALKFKGAEKGIEDLAKCAEQFDMSNMEDSCGKVGKSFNVLQEIAIGALRKIGEQAVVAGEQLVKSLTVDQITAGFDKFTQKAGNVQTLMNATGKSASEVEGYLNKLMWYSDETSFSFSEMSTALASMVSSGGDIDKLIPVIEGIGNATAFAGKSGAEFQRVIYNLNQAYSKGVLTKEDWKSVSLAGVDSIQLKQELMKAAAELGKIKPGDWGVADFEQMMTEKVFTTDVMELAFANFANFTELVREAVDNGEFKNATEAIAALSEEFDDISVKAFQAGQESKSFKEAIDAIKDASSSQWMKIFEAVFGHYEEAKELWGQLYEDLANVFITPMEGVVDTVQTVFEDMGGRQQLLGGLQNIWETLFGNGEEYAGILGTIGRAWNEAFPSDSVSTLSALVTGFNNLTTALMPANTTLFELRRTFNGIFAVVGIFTDFIGDIFGGISDGLKLVDKPGATFLDRFLHFTGDLGTNLVALREWVHEHSFVRDSIARLTEFITKLVTSVKELISNFKLLDGTKSLFDNVSKWATTAFGSIKKTIEDLFKGENKFDVKNFFEIGQNIIQGLINGIGDKLQAAKDAIFNIATAIIDRIMAKDALDEHSPSKKFFEIGANIIQGLIDGVSSLIETAKQLFAGFGETIVNIFNGIDWSSIWTTITDAFGTFVDTLSDIWSRLKLDQIDYKKVVVLVGIFGLFWTIIKLAQAMQNTASSVAKIFNPISDALNGFTTGIKNIGKGIKSLGTATKIEAIGAALWTAAKGLAVLAGALLVLANVEDKGELLKAVGILSLAAGVLGVLVVAINKLCDSVDWKDAASVAVICLSLAGSILLISNALTKLSGIENIGQGLGALAAIFGMIVGIVAENSLLTMFFSDGSTLDKIGAGILAMSAGILLMANVVKKLSKFSQDDIDKAMGFISGCEMLFVAVIGVSHLAGENASKTAAMILAASIGPLLLTSVVGMLSKYKDADIQKALAFISWCEILFAATIGVSQFAGEHAAKTAAALLGMAIAVRLLDNVVDKMTQYNVGDIAKGLLFIAGCGAILDALLYFTKFTGEYSAKTLAALTGMGVAVYLLSSAVGMFKDMELGDIAKGITAVGLISVMIDGMILASNKAGQFSGKAGLMLMSASMALLLVMGSVYLLTLLDTDEMWNAVMATNTILLSFATMLIGLGRFSTSIGPGIGAVATMGGVALAISALLLGMEKLNLQNAKQNADALAEVLMALGVCFFLLNNQFSTKMDLGDAVLVAVQLGVILGLIVAAFEVLTKWPVSVDKSTIDGMCEMMLAASVACAICAAIGLIGPSALIGIGALVVFVTAWVGLAEILGQIVNNEQTFRKGLDLLVEIGGAMGRFLGEFVGGVFTGVVNSLSNGLLVGFADNLTDFAKHMNDFFNELKNIPSDALANCTTLLGCVALLVGADGLSLIAGAKSKIEEFFGMEDSLIKVFKRMGTAIGEYCKIIRDYGLTEESLSQAKLASDILANIAKAEVPTTGGLASLIFGEKDYSKFAGNLINLADGVVSFVAIINGKNDYNMVVTTDGVSAAVEAMNLLSSMAENMPSTGGLLQGIMGEKNLSQFGVGLKQLAIGLVNFTGLVNGHSEDYPGLVVNKDNVTNAVEALNLLVTMAEKLPQTGGLWGFITGKQDFGKFGDSLTQLAFSLVGFTAIVNGESTYYPGVKVDSQSILAATTACDLLITLANKLPEANSLWDFIGGKKKSDFGELGRQIAQLAVQLVTAQTNFNQVDFSNYDKLIVTIGKFIDLTEPMQGFATASETFKTSLVGLSSGVIDSFIQTFSDATDRFVAAGIQMLADFATGMNNAKPNVLDTIKMLFDDIFTKRIDPRMVDFHDEGSFAVSSIDQGMREPLVVNVLMNTVSTMVSDMLDILRGEYNNWYQAGSYLVDGFCAGITENTFKAEARAAVMAAAARRAAEKELDEHSPSKVFFKIGAFLVQGFVNGIVDKTGLADKAGQTLASTVEKSVGSSLSNMDLSSYLDASSLTPEIKPVVDMSQLDDLSAYLNGNEFRLAFEDVGADIGFGLDDDVTSLFTTKIADSNDILMDMQKQTQESNKSLQATIEAMRNDLAGYSEDWSKEYTLSVDGKELSGSLAPYMNKDLSKLYKRGN